MEDIKMIKQKKLVKRAFSVLTLVFVVALGTSLITLSLVTQSIDEGNLFQAEIAISKSIGCSKESVKALKMVKEGQVIFVLYKDLRDERHRLAVFEQFGFIEKSYRMTGNLGGNLNPKPRIIEKLGYSGPFKGLPSHLSIMVVFGANPSGLVDSYVLYTGTGEFSRNIKKQEFVLDIFYYNRINSSFFHLQIFDESGQIIYQ